MKSEINGFVVDTNEIAAVSAIITKPHGYDQINIVLRGGHVITLNEGQVRPYALADVKRALQGPFNSLQLAPRKLPRFVLLDKNYLYVDGEFYSSSSIIETWEILKGYGAHVLDLEEFDISGEDIDHVDTYGPHDLLSDYKTEY